MADVGAAESPAGGAIALGIERTRVRAILGALDVEPTVAGEHRPVPSHPRRRDAVEQVDSAANSLDQIFREADSHQIAGMDTRQRTVDDLEHLVHGALFLADREPADA